MVGVSLVSVVPELVVDGRPQPTEQSVCLAGIFVGGQARRLGSVPKGLLRVPETGCTIVHRLSSDLRALGIERIVLVGRHPAYLHLGWTIIRDAQPGRGPMGGLLGLVRHAMKLGILQVLAIACDMPNLSACLLRRLIREHREADALVPERERLEPLCARYRVAAVAPLLEHLLASGCYRMTSLLDALGTGCVHLALDQHEAAGLNDWDSPSDLPGDLRSQLRLRSRGNLLDVAQRAGRAK